MRTSRSNFALDQLLFAYWISQQFWVARAECQSQFKDAVEITLEQIDVIKRLVSNYSAELTFATSYKGKL